MEELEQVAGGWARMVDNDHIECFEGYIVTCDEFEQMLNKACEEFGLDCSI